MAKKIIMVDENKNNIKLIHQKQLNIKLSVTQSISLALH